MKKMLITGGTVFVSRFAAQYYAQKYDVYVLNRNSRSQVEGVTLIEADRHCLGGILGQYHFDVVLDITAYCAEDINDLLDGLKSFDDYVLISSSAVYPETARQPFSEETAIGPNRFWGKYGTDKIAAENALRIRVPDAYILRPPYLYGLGNNVYREAFVFDCAGAGREFYLPGDGRMKLQFFNVRDLCRFIDVLLEKHPQQRVYNVGNVEAVSIRDWVSICYEIAGRKPEFVHVNSDIEPRCYFPFYNYEYLLDVGKQTAIMPKHRTLSDGLAESFFWYIRNADKVMKKPLMEFIDRNLKGKL